jgi:hypothetical protein
MLIWVLYPPVRLRQGNWALQRQEVGEGLIDVLSVYALNIRAVILAKS